MAEHELTADILEEARRILRKDPPEDWEHEDVVLFVDKGGDILPADSADFKPGMVGHFSVAPKVYAITAESSVSQEQVEEIRQSLETAKAKLLASKKLPKSERPDAEELEEMEDHIAELEEDLESQLEEEITVALVFTLDWSQLEQEKQVGVHPVGAFVYAPTKDGTGNMDKPVVLNSESELKEFMLRWSLNTD